MRFGLQLLSLLFIIPWQAFSQYSNDWIRPGQEYFRIPIAKEGVYKLTYTDLQNAGVPVAVIDPRLIQLFHRGKEQAISVKGQADAVLNTDDYVEFFGQANDGTLDQSLYKPSSVQPHNYYNLFSDTTAYFFTWSNAASAGKRITAFDEVNVTNIAKEVFHNQERILINKSQYSGGETFNDVIQYTHFDVGEGWTGNAISQGQSIDYTLEQINNLAIGSGNPQLEILLVGRDQISHTAEILVGPNSGSLRSVYTTSFQGFEATKISLSLAISDIGADGKLIVRLVAPSATTNRPQFSASYLKLSFPQNFNVNGINEVFFNLQPKPSGKTYVEWDNAPAAMRVWDVTDPMSISSIGTRVSANSLTAMVGSTETTRRLYAFTTTSTPSVKKVSFRLLDPLQSDYIIISNQVLMKPALSYNDPVKAYAGYRASAPGGSYDTLVVTMDQLYNQFNYGETSPMAIYEFMRFMVNKGAPKYLFLIGKGRDVNAGFHRIINPGPGVLKDLVPSAGFPASDMNFTVGLADTSYEPAVATGRLSVTTPLEVANYLNKIKETENPNKIQDWQKNGLHLSGGIQPLELPTFREYVDSFKATAEGIYWGSSITTIAKRDPSVVELINVADEVNAGVNLITFFGHSSPSTIDIDIGFASDPVMGYNNAGKYPVMLINGCNAGNFFSNGVFFGEDWISAPRRGARNVIAHSSFGFVSTLRSYSDYFYRIGFADSIFIKKGVGDLQKEVARQYMQSAPAVISNITQVQQMVLLGDPAVRLFQNNSPDYEITNSSLRLISLDSKPITALTNSFAIQIVVRNLGLVKNTPVRVTVQRTFSNGSTVSYDSTFAPLFRADTLLFKIHRGLEDGAGDNTFIVKIDSDNKIKETNEENNQASLQKSISRSATLNLFPIAYGVVNTTSVNFIWQSSDPLSVQRDFQLEVDTTISFSSPFVIRKNITGKVLAKANIEILNQDSTVYFWRTRFAKPVPGESEDWIVSSFSFIKDGQEGWAQLRKDQLIENFFNGIINAGEGKVFRFEETKTSVEIKTFGSNNPLPATDVSVKINGSEYNLSTQDQPCRNNTLNLIAFNKTTAVPYAGIPFNFQDPRTCGREPQLINSFQLSELETGLNDDLSAFVNAVGASDSVVLFSIGDPGYINWSTSVKATLGELGIAMDDLNTLLSGEPVVIFGKKGASPGSAKIFKSSISPTNEQLIFVAREITGKRTEGNMKSVLIGPAHTWHSFYNKETFVESSDQVKIIVYGLNINGEETLISDDASNGYDLSAISADQFPYLRLVYDAKDELNLTPADWKNWLITYEPVAEGVLFYDGSVQNQQVQEGQSWSTRFGFTNVSNKNFSNLLKVDLEVLTQQTQHWLSKDSLITAPLPGETVFFNAYSSTVGKAGMNDIAVYVNRKEVPEQYYDNNFANLTDYLMVKPDKTNPVLEVTIDDREVRNGDFVSSKPLIQITLKDENQFMLKTDAGDVSILLQYPCQCDPQKIPIINSDTLKWYPAASTSDFRVDFMPKHLTDGDYELQVTAPDGSGNQSVDKNGVPIPYTISFKVKSETTFDFKGVYPNPSSIGFFFNFTLSGNKLPEDFSLEIFSSTGQLVSRFNIDDIRKFYIGTNELIWNGADATGKILNQGIYLYRLRVKTEEIDTVNIGKLVWIR